MSLSIRELIFETIETILKGVSGLDVRRGRIDPLEIQYLYTAWIIPGTDTVVQDDIGDKIDRELAVHTFLWIKTQSNIIKEVEIILPQVQQALASDYTLRGLAKYISETSVSEPIPLDEAESEAGLILEHSVFYRVNRVNPYSQS